MYNCTCMFYCILLQDFATILSETISTVTRLGELLVCLNTITAVHHINDNHAINVLQKLIEALC